LPCSVSRSRFPVASCLLFIQAFTPSLHSLLPAWGRAHPCRLDCRRCPGPTDCRRLLIRLLCANHVTITGVSKHHQCPPPYYTIPSSVPPLQTLEAHIVFAWDLRPCFIRLEGIHGMWQRFFSLPPPFPAWHSQHTTHGACVCVFTMNFKCCNCQYLPPALLTRHPTTWCECGRVHKIW
jgi:hypothetical protein